MIDINELIKILNEIKRLIENDHTDVSWSRYNTINEALADIDSHIISLKNNDFSKLFDLKILFAPTGSFQEISINSGWGDHYLTLANRFDNIINN